MQKQLLITIFAAAFIFVAGLAPAGIHTSELQWYKLEKAQELADKNGKKVLVFAEASWCTYCKRMKREVFPEKGVQATIADFYYPVRIDIESESQINFNGQDMSERQFARSMKISRTPTFLFISPRGEVLGGQPGYLPADIFKGLLSYVGSDAYSRIEFQEYYENEYQSGSQK